MVSVSSLLISKNSSSLGTPTSPSTAAPLDYQFVNTASAQSPADRTHQPVSFVNATKQSGGDTMTYRAVPEQLLEAADAILKAGGYKESARAYAELSVRFGSNPELLVRRFVANVLSRDLDQAEIIVHLAKLTKTPMDTRFLESASLSEFVDSILLVEAASEALAARALANRTDPTSLRSVAQWLGLAGDEQRSAMFLLAADRLEKGNDSEEVQSELVIFD